MAGELRAITGRPGRTAYFVIFSRISQVWNGTAFEDYSTANYATYDVAATEIGTNLGGYKATFPSTIAGGVYDIILKEQQGGSPAENDPVVAVQDGLQWGGTVTIPLSDMVTSGQLSESLPIQITRGTAKPDFHIYLRSAADHITPFVSGVVSGQVLRDNGSWVNLQSGAFTEKGNGVYRLLALTSGDLDAAVLSLLFTAKGVSGGLADPYMTTWIMQRRSGS